MDMPPGEKHGSLPLVCHRCGEEQIAGQGTFYVVRIEAFADPTPGDVSSQDLTTDIPGEINRLVEQMSQTSEQELMDQVYRRLTIYLCGPCYRRWIENPAG